MLMDALCCLFSHQDCFGLLSQWPEAHPGLVAALLRRKEGGAQSPAYGNFLLVGDPWSLSDSKLGNPSSLASRCQLSSPEMHAAAREGPVHRESLVAPPASTSTEAKERLLCVCLGLGQIVTT